MRMCVGCRQMHPKKELTRVVRSKEGDVKLDPTGKAAGRGAYICKSVPCLMQAIKTRALERALEVKIETEIIDALRNGLEDEG